MEKKLKNGKESEFALDSKAVKTLADILNKSSLTEIEYTHGETVIRVAKQVAQIAAAQPISMPVSQVISAPVVDDNMFAEKTITAPVVGKIYVAPKPGAQAFIKVGDNIKEGDVIFIIEAMKVMNNVKADKAGVIKEIFVKDGQPVEYGQKLLSLE